MGYTSHASARLNQTQNKKVHADEPGAVFVFGIDSMWVTYKSNLPLYYKYFCNDRVAVHISWYNDGYQFPVFYNKSHHWHSILEWCSDHAPNRHLKHPHDVVVFKDQTTAMQFAMMWS